MNIEQDKMYILCDPTDHISSFRQYLSIWICVSTFLVHVVGINSFPLKTIYELIETVPKMDLSDIDW